VSSADEVALLGRALQLLELGRLDQAERVLRDLVGLDPGDPNAYSLLSLVLFDLGRYREAEDCAGEAIALDPELAIAHGALARALVGQERFKAAATAVREAIRLDPDDPLNHEVLAACELARGKWPEARASAERALALAPDSATAHGLRSVALTMTGGDPKEWQSAAADALRADPGSSTAHAFAANAALNGGHEHHAVAGFEEALRLDPESAFAQAGLAEALKAAHPLFRPFFRFFMWQQRLDGRAKAALIIVPLVAVRVLRPFAGNPVVLALVIAWIVLVALTWLAIPLANVALRLTPRGRAILPAAQRRSSSTFAALLGGALVALVLAVAVSGVFAETAFALVLLALSAGSAHGLPPRRRRVFEIVLAVAVAAALIGGVLVAAGVNAGVFPLLAAFLAGVVLIWVVRLS